MTTESHLPEYLMEAAELALFMISACLFTALLEHPASPVRAAIPDALARRGLMGFAMGATAVAIVFSPLGKRSGAHFNPAVTLTFWRLDRVAGRDALGYVAAQFAGAAAGIAAAGLLLRERIGHPNVNWALTKPGARGVALAFAAEVAISFLLMSVVLEVSSRPGIARWTGLFAGACVALFIAFEAPISGMSMNPARSFGSAAGAHRWSALWLYFTAPPLGMLLAAEARLRLSPARPVLCAKLHHDNAQRCIFRCDWGTSPGTRRVRVP